MAQSGVQPRVAMARDVPLASAHLRAADPGRVPVTRVAPGAGAAHPRARAVVHRRSPPKPTEPRSPGVDRSTWERHALTADVELHVRRPLDRRSNKRVEQLIRIARELFDDEP